MQNEFCKLFYKHQIINNIGFILISWFVCKCIFQHIFMLKYGFNWPYLQKIELLICNII